MLHAAAGMAEAALNGVGEKSEEFYECQGRIYTVRRKMMPAEVEEMQKHIKTCIIRA